ncbi:uncharacterized protein A4U43_C09F11500 [Asparagus officinalis]|uniref:Pentacotripeptide-repeat region of PRORP domain-containing protein n=1 Tax=Asparagus officinalis TaxID=4686 RepID=A0A5P1EA24_ASPOF|nr:uncharacterized protein A4U43_C09F11500 [Asparagus officinalis]
MICSSSDNVAGAAMSFICSSLIGSMCTHDRIGDAAAQLLDRMPRWGCTPDVVAYTTVIKGLCSLGNTRLAIEFLEKMKVFGEVKPDVVTYNTIVDGLCKQGEMRTVPLFSPTPCIMHDHSVRGHWEEAMRVFKEMVDCGLCPHVTTFHTLVDSLCKQGNTSEAHKLLKAVTESGVKTRHSFLYHFVKWLLQRRALR